MEFSPEDKVLTAIADEAAAWFVKNRSPAVTAAERAAFIAWLRESPVHVHEYLAIATLARDVEAVARESAAELEQVPAAGEAVPAGNVVDFGVAATAGRPLSDRSGRAARPRGFAVRLAAAVAVVAIVAGFWALNDAGIFGEGRTYVTGHGQQQTIRLADGSVLRLNSDSEARVHFSETERRVELRAGQALFEVAHEPRRAFRVLADGISIVAVGTQFDVYRQPNATVVTVVEGKVAVLPSAEGFSGPRSAGAATAASIPLGEGEQLRVERRSQRPKVTKLGSASGKEATANVNEAVAWVRQQIIFEQKSLAEVADEFNRYGEVPIRIDDPELSHMQVSGIFSVYDTDAFIRFLQRLEGVTVQTTPTGVHVTRQRSHDSAPPRSTAQ